MIKFRIGDQVKLIDDNSTGVVIKIDNQRITIEDEFGFEQEYDAGELLPDLDFDQEIPEETTNTKEEKEDLSSQIHESIKNNFSEFKEKLEHKNSAPKKSKKSLKNQNNTFLLDLHYGKLEDYSAQLPVQFILKKQLNAAKSGIEKAKSQGFKKIILVHGKGKGVLETELKKWLDGEGYTHYDADFRRYKLGATEVEL